MVLDEDSLTCRNVFFIDFFWVVRLYILALNQQRRKRRKIEENFSLLLKL
jgi:hypothetical protein